MFLSSNTYVNTLQVIWQPVTSEAVCSSTINFSLQIVYRMVYESSVTAALTRDALNNTYTWEANDLGSTLCNAHLVGKGIVPCTPML